MFNLSLNLLFTLLEFSFFLRIMRFSSKLCDRMRFEAKCVKSQHRIILEGLYCKSPGGAYFFQALLRGGLFNLAKCISSRKNTVVRDRTDLHVVQVIISSM